MDLVPILELRRLPALIVYSVCPTVHLIRLINEHFDSQQIGSMNSLRTRRISVIQSLSPYRAVNTALRL
jgi:hypothetical protein